MQNRTRNLRFKQRPDALDFYLVRARLRVLQEDQRRRAGSTSSTTSTVS